MDSPFVRNRFLNSISAIALTAALFLAVAHGPRLETPHSEGLLFLVPIVVAAVVWGGHANGVACEFGSKWLCEEWGGYKRTWIGFGVSICDTFLNWFGEREACYNRPDEDFDRDIWSLTSTRLQNRLDRYAPLALGNFPYAHNSYNSQAYAKGSRYQFWNQRHSVYAQLDLGARMLEYDLWHCHGDVRLSHGFGFCPAPTPADRTLKEGLDEIERWFDADPSRRHEEVVLMYFEDKLSSGEHTAAGNVIDNHAFADRVFTPADFEMVTGVPTCTNQEDFLWTISKDDVLRAGKNIVVVSKGDAWSCGNPYWQYVFPTSFPYGKYGKYKTADVKSFPACLDDEPYLNEAVYKAWNEIYPIDMAKITASQVRRMQLCGFNAIGPEPMGLGDVPGQIWSWAELYPQQDGVFEFDASRLDDTCAAQHHFIELPNHEALDSGRFVNRACGQTKRYACQNLDTREWRVTSSAGAFENGASACAAEFGNLDIVFSVPVNAQENYFLRQAGGSQEEYWVNYSATYGAWEPFEATFEYEVAVSDGVNGVGIATTFSQQQQSSERQEPEINGWPAERIAGIGFLSMSQRYDQEAKYVGEDFTEDGNYLPPVQTVYRLNPTHDADVIAELHASPPTLEGLIDEHPESIPNDPDFFDCVRRETRIESLDFVLDEDGTSIEVTNIAGTYTSEGRMEPDFNYLPELRFYCNDFHKDTKSIVNATGTYDPLTGELTIRHIQPGGAAITLEN
ncbi:MAG: hypothetical protein AAF997_20135, partial [Myxococcota bacterium]